MKKTKIIMYAAAMSMLFAGCSSTATTKGGMHAKIPIPEPEDYRIVYEHSPTRVESKATVSRFLFWTFGEKPDMLQNESRRLFGFGESVKNLSQNAALYDACQRNKADALIGATYEVTVKDYLIFKTATCTAKGFPAKIVDVKKAETSPIYQFRIGPR